MILLKFFRTILPLATLILLPALSQAQSYQLGEATYSGTGCPPGSISVSTSPDASAISILFTNFSVAFKAPDYRKSTACSIRIPLSVSPGYILEATSIDYRGFIDLPNRATSITLLTTGNISTARMPSIVNKGTNFVGPITDNFTVSHRVPQSAPQQRKCNTVSEMKLNISAGISSRSFALAELSLDSADVGVDSGMTMGVILRPCTR